MWNLLLAASDDQTAIGVSMVTLLVSALFVFASFHLGPAGQKQRQRNRLPTLHAADRTPLTEARERAA